MRFHIIITLILGTICSSALAISEVDLPVLPRDEDDAQMMIAEGSLSVAVWQKIEHLYTAPLCVPRGELELLIDLFTGLPAELPTRMSTLSKYIPWDDAAIKRFFYDFPELVPFKPVLSFENSGARPFPGSMGLHFSHPALMDTMRQYGVFSLGGPGRTSLRGRVDFTDSYGRWAYRSVKILPHSSCEVTLGNYSIPWKERIFYGNFVPVSESGSTVSENWLYGTSRSWNGAKVSFQGHAMSTIPFDGSLLVHARPAEQILLCRGNVMLTSHSSVALGASKLTVIDSLQSRTSYRYLHGTFSITPAAGWNSELQTGIDINHPAEIPFCYTGKFRDDRFGFYGSIFRLPAGFSAPRSELLRLYARDDSLPDTSAPLGVDLGFNHVWNSWLCYSPRIETSFNGSSLRSLRAAAEISGDSGLCYRASYSWSMQFDHGELATNHHRGLLSFTTPSWYRTKGTCVNTVYYSSSGYWRFQSVVSASIGTGRVVTLQPLVTVTRARERESRFRMGIRMESVWSRQAFSDISVEQEVPRVSSTGTTIKGMVSFAL